MVVGVFVAVVIIIIIIIVFVCITIVISRAKEPKFKTVPLVIGGTDKKVQQLIFIDL